MKERPILFSTEMVQAIIEGRKTMTRRLLKVRGCKPFIPDDHFTKEDIERWNKNYHPYGNTGEILWVRESFCNVNKPDFDPEFVYKTESLDAEDYDPTEWNWKPSIHMPKAAARIYLEITNIRVERLNVITEDDAMREGVDRSFFYKRNIATPESLEEFYNQGFYKRGFRIIWKSINGMDSWKSNPWVWVISFKTLSTTGRPDFLPSLETLKSK